MAEYDFTSDWFSAHIPVWTALLGDMPVIGKILEIGSYEGRSAVWLLEHGFRGGGSRDLYCIDTWEGAPEHAGTDMSAVEARFHHNVGIASARSGDAATHVLKGRSDEHLVSLIAGGHRASFDVIYVDGSHDCSHVLSDLVLAFQLCRVDGIIICDDYLWRVGARGQENLLDQPKLAIDAFVNCYARRLALYNTPLYQLHIRKTSP